MISISWLRGSLDIRTRELLGKELKLFTYFEEWVNML